jgi:hypothetical protein
VLPLQKLRRLSSGAFASVSLVLLVTAAAYGQIPEPDFSHDIPFEEIPAFLAQFDWVLYVALAGMVATILLLALLGVGNSRAKARAGVEHGPQLPDELRAVAILGARYRLETFSGPSCRSRRR